MLTFSLFSISYCDENITSILELNFHLTNIYIFFGILYIFLLKHSVIKSFYFKHIKNFDIKIIFFFVKFVGSKQIIL